MATGANLTRLILSTPAFCSSVHPTAITLPKVNELELIGTSALAGLFVNVNLAQLTELVMTAVMERRLVLKSFIDAANAGSKFTRLVFDLCDIAEDVLANSLSSFPLLKDLKVLTLRRLDGRLVAKLAEADGKRPLVCSHLATVTVTPARLDPGCN